MPDIKPKVVIPMDLSSANLAHWVDVIIKLDADGYPMMMLGSINPADPLDGLALAAFCAAKTHQIGVCAAIDPEIVEPFTLARGLAALDHLSQGRAAWYLSSIGNPLRTVELIEVTRLLLKSWDNNALVDDIEHGLMSKSESVQAIKYEGKFFSVEGPLNTPQPPQGAVPLIALSSNAETMLKADIVLGVDQISRFALDDVSNLPSFQKTPIQNSQLRDRLEAMI